MRHKGEVRRGHEGHIGFRSACSAARPPSLDALHGSAVPVQFNRLSVSACILPGSLRFSGLPVRSLKTQSPPASGGNKGLPTHPPEPAYPCCLPALGEFCEVTPHEEPRPSLRHNRHPRQRGRRQCSDGPRGGDEPRLGNGSPRSNEPRRPGQCADATADRTSTPFQTSEHRLAFSAAARRQCDNQKSTTSLFLMRARYNARHRAVRSRSRR